MINESSLTLHGIIGSKKTKDIIKIFKIKNLTSSNAGELSFGYDSAVSNVGILKAIYDRDTANLKYMCKSIDDNNSFITKNTNNNVTLVGNVMALNEGFLSTYWTRGNENTKMDMDWLDGKGNMLGKTTFNLNRNWKLIGVYETEDLSRKYVCFENSMTGTSTNINIFSFDKSRNLIKKYEFVHEASDPLVPTISPKSFVKEGILYCPSPSLPRNTSAETFMKFNLESGSVSGNLTSSYRDKWKMYINGEEERIYCLNTGDGWDFHFNDTNPQRLFNPLMFLVDNQNYDIDYKIISPPNRHSHEIFAINKHGTLVSIYSNDQKLECVIHPYIAGFNTNDSVSRVAITPNGKTVVVSAFGWVQTYRRQ